MYNGIKKIINKSDYEYDHETPEILRSKEFNKEMRKYLKRQLKSYDLELLNSSDGYCYFSGFIKNKITNKLVYISTYDYRHFPNRLFDDVLIRTAEHEKDYTGGSNHSCALNDIAETAYKMTT